MKSYGDALAQWKDRIHLGDVREILRRMPTGCIQAVVTSPPYWGLREYGVRPTVWGGDPNCDHLWGPEYVKGGPGRAPGRTTRFGNRRALKLRAGLRKARMGAFCWCGAWRGQLGLEPMPSLYIEHLVGILREIRRVLRPDGTVWLNLGDCYTDSGRGTDTNSTLQGSRQNQEESRKVRIRESALTGLPPKNLMLLPHRVAIALQEDGWYVRQDIVWQKPNPMPESTKDRPTRAHEYVFLLSKSELYFYDHEAIKEPVTWNAHPRGGGVNPKAGLIKRPTGWDGETGWHRSHRRKLGRYKQNESFSKAVCELVDTRNKRSVWTVKTEGFPGAHFATFPQALVAPCIAAGTSEKGACAECGAPWERISEVWYENPGNRTNNGQKWQGRKHEPFGTGAHEVRLERHSRTIGWQPTCECHGKFVKVKKRKVVLGQGFHDVDWWYVPNLPLGMHPTVSCVVLDPFMGSGTTAVVAVKLRRSFVGIEISRKYVQMARERIAPELAQGRLF